MLLKRVAEQLRARMPELAEAWTGQVDATIGFSKRASQQAPNLFDYYGDLIATHAFVQPRVRPNGGRVHVVQEPVGVVAAITPLEGAAGLAVLQGRRRAGSRLHGGGQAIAGNADRRLYPWPSASALPACRPACSIWSRPVARWASN